MTLFKVSLSRWKKWVLKVIFGHSSHGNYFRKYAQISSSPILKDLPDQFQVLVKVTYGT